MPGADQPGDAQALAPGQVEVDSPQWPGPQVADLQHGVGGTGAGCRTVGGLHVLARHELRQQARSELGDRAGGDPAPAADHGDPVGEREDLVHPVRDVQDTGPGVADLPHDVEEAGHLAGRQYGGGLVEHQDPAAALPALQRGGDGHHRALDGGGRHQGPAYVDAEAEPFDEGARPPLHLRPADVAEGRAGEAMAEREVVDGAQLAHQPQLLVDETEPVVAGRRDLTEAEGLAVEFGHRTRLRVVVAGEDLDEGRLAGAVGPDQGVDLAGHDLEIDVLQRLGAAESLRQGGNPKHRPGQLSPHSALNCFS